MRSVRTSATNGAACRRHYGEGHLRHRQAWLIGVTLIASPGKGSKSHLLGGRNVHPARIALSGYCLLAGIACQHSAKADDQSLEEIVVTGTRIARPSFDAASPIVAVQAAEFQRTSSATAETTLNRYPQFVPGYTGTSNFAAGLNSYSDGRAGLNLRGLGDNRTLTLVDGRRLTPVNANGETDLTVIPPALIESVEIVTGGASAVYGSDAVAGVVNFRLRQDLDGVELGGRWGQTDRGDGEEYDISVTAGTGFAEGRGSLVGYVGYYDRAQINQSARTFSRASLDWVGPGNGNTGPGNAYVPRGSLIAEEGVAAVPDAHPTVFDEVFESYGYPGGTAGRQFDWVQQRRDIVHYGHGRPRQRRKFPRPGRSSDLELLFPWLQLRDIRRLANAADSNVGLCVGELRRDRRPRGVRHGHLRRLHRQYTDRTRPAAGCSHAPY